MRAAHCGSSVSYTISVCETWWHPIWMFNKQVISWKIHVTCGMSELQKYNFVLKIKGVFFQPLNLVPKKREPWYWHETAAHVSQVEDRNTSNINPASLFTSLRTRKVWNAANGTETNSEENNNDVWRIRSANERRWRQQFPTLINLISRHGVLHMETCFSLQDKAVAYSVWRGWKEIFLLLFWGVWRMWAQYALACLQLITKPRLSHYEHICRGQVVAFVQLKAAWTCEHRQVSMRNAQTNHFQPRSAHTWGSWAKVIKLQPFSGVSSPLFDI